MVLPKISIVTPSFNQGRFIEDAILSVLHQGYPNFEHIIVDGGSQDGTLEILRKYRHLRWISEPDCGQSDAINKGFLMSTGNLVGWLNADDYYLPGAFEAIGNFAVENPECDVIYGNSMFVDAEGRLLRLKIEHAFDFGVLLYYGCYIPSTGGTFVRRSVIEDGFLLDTNYKVVMDFEYFVRLAAAERIFRWINRVLCAFRWHGSNQSLHGHERRQERLRVQRAWSGVQLPDVVYNAFAHLFRCKRVVYKIFDGAYKMELKERRFRTQDTRWFLSANVCQACAQLVGS